MKSKTLEQLLATRHWIAHIDDERNIGNSIIVTLEEGWDFADIGNCGVNGFDTVAETKAGTSRHKVVQRVIHIKMARVI
jgi:hypothetical protein